MRNDFYDMSTSALNTARQHYVTATAVPEARNDLAAKVGGNFDFIASQNVPVAMRDAIKVSSPVFEAAAKPNPQGPAPSGPTRRVGMRQGMRPTNG